MKDGSEEKKMPLFGLPSLVSIGQSKLKFLSRNCISIFSNSDLDLDHRHLGSNPKLRLDISFPYSKFCVNRLKQTKVIERKTKVDERLPTANFSITITRFSLKTWLKSTLLTTYIYMYVLLLNSKSEVQPPCSG